MKRASATAQRGDYSSRGASTEVSNIIEPSLQESDNAEAAAQAALNEVKCGSEAVHKTAAGHLTELSLEGCVMSLSNSYHQTALLSNKPPSIKASVHICETSQ